MGEHDSSPQTTLVILLGASQWPEFPDFHGSQTFANVASDFSRYLLDQEQFGLPRENFLNLFDTDLSPDKIDKEIRHFLDRRTSEMKQVGQDPRDLLFYFVGHGGFVGRNSEYYLAVRCTSSANPAISGIRVEPLATTITSRARYLRRLIILDCCYAAAAFSAFQAEGPAQVAIRQTVEVFKEKAKRVGKGTSLLCSSGKKVSSPLKKAPLKKAFSWAMANVSSRATLLTAEDDYTMFSKALLHVLATRGNPYRPDEAYLSLREVANLTEEVLDRLLEEKAPRPELHSPDQVDGDVADVPFFPNPVVKTVQASQSKQVLPIDRIVKKALAKLPEDRFQSAEEFNAAFALASHAPSVVHQTHTIDRQNRVISRKPTSIGPRPSWVAFVTILLLLVTLGAGLTTSMLISHVTRSTPHGQATAPTSIDSNILADRLATNQNDWPTSSTFFFVNGQYHIQNKSARNVALALYAAHDFADLRLTVTMSEVHGLRNGADYYGVVIRSAADQSHYYIFEVLAWNGGQYAFLRYDGQYETFATGPAPSLHLKPGQNNTITVEAVGTTFTFFINGKAVGSPVTDSSKSAWITGEIGLYVEEQNAEVVFSDLIINPLK